ncbi:zinc finger, CCHC-type containing protein [Tanacetum coccineum]
MPTNLGKSLRTSPSMTMRAGMTQKNSSNRSREEAKSPVTKNVNSISLAKEEEERNDNDDMAADDGINRIHMKMPVKEAEKETKAEIGTKNKPIKRAEREETAETSSSQPIGYYLKHRINEKLIEGLVDNHRKEDIRGNFEIPCNIGGLKCMNALVDQGSDVNVMPLSTYMKLTDERPAETDIKLSLASHSYIYPLGIAEDVLVDVAGLYLIRRSLEVLRKFHWMILGGRFNQLSHVSSLLLSKPGEY